jgi:hypothetical protein
MKHLKILGVVLVAATALFAIVGAGTAPATVICKNNLNTEKCSEPYPVGTKGKASLTESIRATTTEGTVLSTCTGSVVESTLEKAGSSTTTVKSGVSTITWSGCTNSTITINGGFAELHHIAGTDNGTLTTFNTEVTINTGFFGSCVFSSGGGTDVGTTVGGNPGSFTLNAVFQRVSGLCPSTLRVTGKYVATEPKNAWVSAG